MKARLKTVMTAISASAAVTTALLLAPATSAVAAQASSAQASPASPSSPVASSDPNPWAAKSGLPADAARRLQAAIDAQIAKYGGTQISPYEVAYNGGDPIMVFANPLTGRFPTSAADRAEARQPAAPGRPGVAVTLAPLATSYRDGCPYTSTTGWTCFYQNIDYNHQSCGGTGSCGDGGRLLEFATCGNQSLATYGFSGQTTSWVNNANAYVTVYDANDSLLWSESPGSASSYVGSAANDKADSFWLIC